ncbi:MAG: TonB-dependent receptor [Bacteroidales bacterium]
MMFIAHCSSFKSVFSGKLKSAGMGFFMLLVAVASFGQEVTLKGYIRDSRSGESLSGATLAIMDMQIAANANAYGFYNISLPPGRHTLVFSFVGYQSVEKTLDLQENSILNVELVAASRHLQEVVVTGKKPARNVSDVRISAQSLTMETMKTIPAFMGEVDVMKSLMLLPGVSSGGEGSTGLFVRGGGMDQNLILLDDATVYNASHLMGIFSVFNPDAIKAVQIFKGGIPAWYGGRLSSVVDIRMTEGNATRLSGSGGIGSIASRLTLEGPLRKETSSFLISGRRTYADLFLPLAPDTSLHNNRLYFYDLNVKVDFQLNEDDRVYFSSYAGSDILGISNEFLIGWGNITTALRWNHIFNNELSFNISLLYSRFDYLMGSRYQVNSFDWTSFIEDMALKADWTWFLNPDNTMRFGVQSVRHWFNPGDIQGVGKKSAISNYVLPRNNALEHSLYFSNEQNLSAKLTVEYGLRYTLFQNIGPGTVYEIDDQYQVRDTLDIVSGKVYHQAHGPEPRLSLRYRLKQGQSLKASYNRTRQYIQQTNTTTSGSPLDIWFPSSPNVLPQYADQVALGYFRNFMDDVVEFSLEGYYKHMGNHIDFKDHAQVVLNPHLEADLRRGDAWSYGLELMVRKTRGRFSGWFSYTYSRAWQQIPGINEGQSFPANFDRPHDLSLVMSMELSPRVTLGASWVYNTGRPVTLPVGRYEFGGEIMAVYSGRNATRLPDYHRLDLSLTLEPRDRPQRRFRGSWSFSVYNAYLRKNVYSYSFRQKEEAPYETQAYKTYLFGIVPAVTYNFEF